MIYKYLSSSVYFTNDPNFSSNQLVFVKYEILWGKHNDINYLPEYIESVNVGIIDVLPKYLNAIGFINFTDSYDNSNPTMIKSSCNFIEF